MTLTIRRFTNKDRVLQYGTVVASLLKDIGNASNQPYLQAIASISLLIMETVQRVNDNKDACMKMTQRACEIICSIINICRDSEAELAPAIILSINALPSFLSTTLEKILTFLRSQVKGGFWRKIFRSMQDADLITECNAGLKHAFDVFGVQSGIMAAITVAEMEKEAKQRHEELIAILKEKRSRPKSSSTSSSDGSSPRKKRPSSLKTDVRTGISMLPASPKIFHLRDEEIKHVINTVTRSSPAARITICGAEGIGKTAVALAASHSAELAEMFKDHRYFIECGGARDVQQLLAAIALQLGLEGTGRKHVIRHLSTLATEQTPVLLVLDALDRAWKLHGNRNDVEDFLSLLADVQDLTLIVTVRGGERPRQVKWTHPFLPMLQPLSRAAARQTFLDISDVRTEHPGLEVLLALSKNNPGTITHMASLASLDGCASLVTRWQHDRSVAWYSDNSNTALDLSNLGTSLLRRFETDGDLDDLTRALTMLEDVVSLLPEGHPDSLSNLHSLGNALLWQFERFGDLASLNRSVGILKEAKDLCSIIHSHREWIVNDLANSLLCRYNHLGDCSDINEAQMLLQEAVLRVPAYHPARPFTLKLFGDALLRRFEHTSELNDIQEALGILREAVGLSPDIDPNNDLGYCLVCRFQRLGNLKDIQDALVLFESSGGSSDSSSLHQILKAVIPTVSQFIHEEHDIAVRLAAIGVLASLAAYPSLHEALGAAIPHLVFILEYDNDVELKNEAALVLEGFLEYPSLQHLLVDDAPLICAQLRRDRQEPQWPWEPQTDSNGDNPAWGVTTTSISRFTQDSAIHRRSQSTWEDSLHPSLLFTRDAPFKIPETLLNYLKNIPSHVPFCGASPQPNPSSGHTNWGAWLTVPDVGKWFTKIRNCIRTVYIFFIAPPFVDDNGELWDLERLGRRLGAFQTWVWAANAALFAASGALLALTSVSSNPVGQSFVILSGIFGLFGFVYATFLAFRIGDCNAQSASRFVESANSVHGADSFWNVRIMLCLPLTWMTWAIISLFCFMLSLGVRQAILDVRPSRGNNATIDSPTPKALSILQLSGFTVAIVWSLSCVFMIHREIRRCADSSSSSMV
ncbi:hypothetical protein B0H16DRAFT_1893242 [Mycena metata]|uniref:ORC1/DEAH AAA+ ATPase domain-containing protein n=1 Tax=Mycena metata TaxID=1033252 RepID=A0AAD7HZC0_9AGAR|nr:hypothetical protein B0H16DRAFT_1893242 [Mycena metata]